MKPERDITIYSSSIDADVQLLYFGDMVIGYRRDTEEVVSDSVIAELTDHLPRTY